MRFRPLDFASPGQARRFINEMVDVVTGALVLRSTDVIAPGGLPLRWTRYYSSARATEQRGLGPGWSHRFDHQLQLDPSLTLYIGPAGLPTCFPPFHEDKEGHEQDGLHLERVHENQYKVSRYGFPALELSRKRDDVPFSLTSVLSAKGWAVLRHDTAGRLESIVSSDEQQISLEWSGELIVQLHVGEVEARQPQHLLRYEYTDRGLLASASVTEAPTIRYEYDAFDRLRRIITSDRPPFFMRYDGEGQCIELGYEDGTERFTFEYHPDAGQTIVHDAVGRRWIYTARADGAIMHVLEPGNGLTQYTVDDNGRVTEITDPGGTQWHILYNYLGAPVLAEAMGREVSLDIEDLPLPPGFHKIGSHSLDWSLGLTVPAPDRLPDVYSLPVDLPGPVYDAVTVIEELGPETMERELDARGRSVSHWFTDGRCRSCEYDSSGAVQAFTDYDGRRTEYCHTTAGRLSEVREPNGAVTRFERSPAGDLRAVVDPAGNRTSFRRDDLGRLVEVHRLARLHDAYSLDALGQLADKWGHGDRALLTVRHGAHRLLESVQLESGEAIDYEWDEADRLDEVISSAGELEFGYDSAVKRREQDTRDDTGVEHRFGRHGLLETIVADAFTTQYDRPNLSQLVVIDPTGQTHTLEHLGFGLVRWTFSNGCVSTSQFDPEGRCLLAALHSEAAPGHSRVQRFTHSDEGDLRTATVSGHGETRYVHDEAHRLTKVTSADGHTTAITYDLAGNVLSKLGASLSYGQGNLLTGVNGVSVEHNERGSVRLISGNPMSWFYYDELDQLVLVKYADGRKVESEYDGLGRRVRKTVGDKEWRFYWDTDRLTAEHLPDGTFRVYVYADNIALVPFLFVDYSSDTDAPSEGRLYSVHTDQLGCPTLVLDEGGRTVWQATFGPFGEAMAVEGQDFHQPLRFPGHYFDQDTGLHWTRFRVYAPLFGRYLQPNPMGIAVSTNLYAAPRSPVSSVNVLGLYPSGLRLDWRSTFQPELRPLRESDSLVLWSSEFDQSDPIMLGLKELKELQSRSYSAIQSCRQLLNREPTLKEEFEPQLLELEASWTKTVNTSEEFSTFSLPSDDFSSLVKSLDALQMEIKKKMLIDDDEDTLM